MSIKTPITILQELSVRNGTCPHYEYIDKNSTTYFQCRVTGWDTVAIGNGRCKKDAKQEAARLLLRKLAEQGKYFPSGCDNLSVPNTTPQAQDALLNSVSLLTDFCSRYHIPPPQFKLLMDTGPPHAKQFTIQCNVGSIERVATALSKKQAKQTAANIILEYFKNNMEDKVLELENHMKEMNKCFQDNLGNAEKMYMELAEEPWRPNLGYIIANYHYGLKEIEKELLDEAKSFISSISCNLQLDESNIHDVEKLLQILKLEYQWEEMECVDEDIALIILKVPHAVPPIFIDGKSNTVDNAKIEAAHKAILYLKQMLNMV